MKKLKVAIKAIEYYLPETVEDEKDLLRDIPGVNIAKMFGKTGISIRHVADKDQCASDLGIAAAEKLLKKLRLDRSEIDVLIFCTQSPDYFLPTTACIMQEKLGLKTSTASFDINLGCSGYVYGLAIGGSLIESGLYSNVLLVCADTYTKYVSKTDKTCRPIFGDAGAATLLCKSGRMGEIGPFLLGSDGSGARNLIVSGGASRNSGEKAVLKMDGAKVFMFTMSQVPRSIEELLSVSGKRLEDIDHFFFHQASKVVLDNIARRMAIPEDKIFRGYEKLGNAVSASIPVALKQASDQKRLRTGDEIMLVGFGVGYSWGACLAQWDSSEDGI